MRKFFLVILCMSLSACAPTGRVLKYGYLLNGHFHYYPSLAHVDLQNRHYKLVVIDGRNTNRISCSDFSVPRDTEFEGITGMDYFVNYLKKMIEENNGVIDADSEETVVIELKALSVELKGLFYGRIWSLVEFEASIGAFRKTYCSSLVDGDKDAPIGKFSLVTRRYAFSRMVSASIHKAIEQFIQDLSEGDASKEL